MTHQLKEMSEDEGASIATVKLLSDLDLTKSTLLSVLVVGVK